MNCFVELLNGISMLSLLGVPQATNAQGAKIGVFRGVRGVSRPRRSVVGALKPWMLEVAIEAIGSLPLAKRPVVSDE